MHSEFEIALKWDEAALSLDNRFRNTYHLIDILGILL